MNEYMKMLGLRAKDVVTGFTGVISTISFDLYGCVQFVVTPEADKDGKLAQGHWFDAKRLTLLTDTPVMAVPSFATMPARTERGPAAKPPAATHTR